MNYIPSKWKKKNICSDVLINEWEDKPQTDKENFYLQSIYLTLYP